MKNTLRTIFSAEAPPPMIWEPQVHGRLYPDRPYFLTRVRQGMAMLSPELQTVFKNAGAQVFVSRRGNSIMGASGTIRKEMDKQDFSPWEKKISRAIGHLKINFLRGVSVAEDRIAFIPQTNLFGSLINQLAALTSLTTEDVTLHEIGHIFSGLYAPHEPLLSRHPAFKQALLNDCRNLGVPERSALLYANHIPSLDVMNDAVADEFFAELFRENISGKNTLSRAFPRGSQFVADEIANAIKGLPAQQKTADTNPLSLQDNTLHALQ